MKTWVFENDLILHKKCTLYVSLILTAQKEKKHSKALTCNMHSPECLSTFTTQQSACLPKSPRHFHNHGFIKC